MIKIRFCAEIFSHPGYKIHFIEKSQKRFLLNLPKNRKFTEIRSQTPRKNL